jgi:hypothetical protein
MSPFDWVHNNKRLMQVVLLLVALPFAFWGIDSYQRVMSRADEVAEVGGQKITEQEFTEALRQQQDSLRGIRNLDPTMLESPAIRTEVLEGMISQRLLMQHAVRNHLAVSNDTLVETTMSIPAFQVDGKFSRERYDAALRNERMSPEMFDAALRRDLLVQQLMSALADSGLASKAVANQFARLLAQQREIAEQRVQADTGLAQAKITADAVREFYDRNPSGRIRRAKHRCADRFGAGRRGGKQGILRVERFEVRRAGAAAREPHPDRTEERCGRRGEGESAGACRADPLASAQIAGELRGTREEELR